MATGCSGHYRRSATIAPVSHAGTRAIGHEDLLCGYHEHLGRDADFPGPAQAVVSLPARPGHTEPMNGGAADRLAELVARGGVCVLSGAGLSTDSGIPDYRGPSGALRARLPMTIAEFRGSPAARQRYWARAHIGWRRIGAAQPNAGHRAVAALQHAGVVGGIITQNVDGLHQAAGARDIIEIHGTLARVVCLECGARSTRDGLDERLRAANPDVDWAAVATSNPDGDVELADEQVARFRLVGCECCGADLLKPDVVFFGENVPRPRVQRCFELVDGSACLLVLGSSLSVMSGLRFVHRARERQIPVVIVNRGVTRGDPLAELKIDAALGDVLPALVPAPR
jgi:NAD-dependent SIR2 family protein deacetylase